ncbi:MAG TPA: LysE family transporter [Pseudobacteroides sp.]|uniref:LysE family transporter n=1 Tax=Pseudobacteroides sp. TaxID=1968840 RepID=UPI002F92CAE3
MVLKGFRFGLILQFAIGPVCIYVFNTATSGGFFPAEAAVLAATLMDAIFVTLAIMGVGSLLEKDRVKKGLKYFGTVVLVYFGVGTILGTFGVKIIPAIAGSSNFYDTSNAFITSFILTASSPLSILFWSGVFATKLSSEGYNKREMKFFGVGAVMATLVFLSVFALIVSLLHPMMNQTVVDVMNVLVGIIIIGFGVKLILRKE